VNEPLPYRATQNVHIDGYGDIAAGEVLYVDLSNKNVSDGKNPGIHVRAIIAAIQAGWLTPVPARPATDDKADQEPFERAPRRDDKVGHSALAVVEKLLRRPDLALEVSALLREVPFAGPWEDSSPRGQGSVRRILTGTLAGTQVFAAEVTKDKATVAADDQHAARYNVQVGTTSHPSHSGQNALRHAKEYADEALRQRGWALMPQPPVPTLSPWHLTHRVDGTAEHRRYELLENGRRGDILATVEEIPVPSSSQALRLRWRAWPKGPNMAASTGEERAKDTKDLVRARNNAMTECDNVLHDAGWELLDDHP
jgi:hypothetical protein